MRSPHGGKPGATRTNNNLFEASRSEEPQYLVDLVKDKRTKNSNLAFLIGWRDFPNPIHDTWEPLAHFTEEFPEFQSTSKSCQNTSKSFLAWPEWLDRGST